MGNHKKLCSMNAKAMNIVYCGLNVDEFNRIFMCKNVQRNMENIRSHS